MIRSIWSGCLWYASDRILFHFFWGLSLLHTTSRCNFGNCYVYVQTLRIVSIREHLQLLRAISDISWSVTRKYFFFFVLASHGSSPVQLSVKSVPFPFWICSSEWLLNLDSAYMGKVNCCPISFSNRRAGTWNICTVYKHCKEWNSHQTGTGYGQFKCLHTYEGKSHQIVQIICHFYSHPRTVWMQDIRLSGVCLLHD